MRQRYFVAYHNAHRMGYSCIAIPKPRVLTRKSVEGLEDATVWLVAGEGKRNKKYYLAARFTVTDCHPNLYPGTRLPNEVSGFGNLFGLAAPIDLALVSTLKGCTANFRNGLSELMNPAIVSSLLALA